MALTGVSWPKLPTPLSWVGAATSVPDEQGGGESRDRSQLWAEDVSFETLCSGLRRGLLGEKPIDLRRRGLRMDAAAVNGEE